MRFNEVPSPADLEISILGEKRCNHQLIPSLEAGAASASTTSAAAALSCSAIGERAGRIHRRPVAVLACSSTPGSKWRHLRIVKQAATTRPDCATRPERDVCSAAPAITRADGLGRPAGRDRTHENYVETAPGPVPVTCRPTFSSTEADINSATEDDSWSARPGATSFVDADRHAQAVKRLRAGADVPARVRRAYVSLTYNIGASAFCSDPDEEAERQGDYARRLPRILRWDKFKGPMAAPRPRSASSPEYQCIGAAHDPARPNRSHGGRDCRRRHRRAGCGAGHAERDIATIEEHRAAKASRRPPRPARPNANSRRKSMKPYTEQNSTLAGVAGQSCALSCRLRKSVLSVPPSCPKPPELPARVQPGPSFRDRMQSFLQGSCPEPTKSGPGLVGCYQVIDELQ